MSTFDIEQLLDFDPPHATCRKCQGIIKHRDSPWEWEHRFLNMDTPHEVEEYGIWCSICRVEYYFAVKARDMSDPYPYLGDRLSLPPYNPFEQAMRLATIARQVRQGRGQWVPIQSLFQALSWAEVFVHFTTTGITQLMLGALKITAQHVPVRGIISLTNPTESILSEIEDNRHEAPNMELRIITPPEEFVHHKLVVVDGLLAFTGSANLTQSNWRRTIRGVDGAPPKDTIDIVSDVDDIIRFHNEYFSPNWAQTSNMGDRIYLPTPNKKWCSPVSTLKIAKGQSAG